MPFIRVRNEDSKDINVNVDNVLSFTAGDAGSTIVFTNGERLAVNESTRSLRGAIKRASADTEESTED